MTDKPYITETKEIEVAVGTATPPPCEVRIEGDAKCPPEISYVNTEYLTGVAFRNWGFTKVKAFLKIHVDEAKRPVVGRMEKSYIEFFDPKKGTWVKLSECDEYKFLEVTLDKMERRIFETKVRFPHVGRYGYTFKVGCIFDKQEITSDTRTCGPIRTTLPKTPTPSPTPTVTPTVTPTPTIPVRISVKEGKIELRIKY